MNYYNNPYQYLAPGYQPQQTYQPQQGTGIQCAWVQGEAAAKAYPMMPNEKMFFFDTESSVMYAREMDATGKPLPMEKYNLVKVSADTPSPVDMKEYVKASDLEGFATEDYIDKAIKKSLNGIGDEIRKAVEDEVNNRFSQFSTKPKKKVTEDE